MKVRCSKSILNSLQQFGSDAELDDNGSVIGGTALPSTVFTNFLEADGTYAAGPYNHVVPTGNYGHDGWQRSMGDYR